MAFCLNFSQTVKSYSTSFPMWMSLRFITGLFTSSAYGVTYTYVLELLTERRRMLLGVINSITFGIGTMYLSLLAYLFNDWRSLARAIAITPGNLLDKKGQGIRVMVARISPLVWTTTDRSPGNHGPNRQIRGSGMISFLNLHYGL